MPRCVLLVALLVVGALLAGAAPAAADTHFRMVGNGQCVLIAPDGGEKYGQALTDEAQA